MRPFLFFSFLFLAFALRSVAMAEPPKCDRIEHLSGRYIVCTFDPATETIRLYGAKTLGKVGATYDQLNTHLLHNGQHMSFAMNGGMYHHDYGPVGLLVEQGRETGALNRDDAFGNFFMFQTFELPAGNLSQRFVGQAIQHAIAILCYHYGQFGRWFGSAHLTPTDC